MTHRLSHTHEERPRTMIGRSRAGTYHHVAGAASSCNGRSFRGSVLATADLIDRAPEEMFCKKCFNINARDKTRKGNALFIFNHRNDGA